MTLVKRNFPGFANLSDFFGDDWLNFKTTDLMPAINVSDNEGNYEIEVAAPGFKKDEFSISVENGVLTVSAKTEKEEEEKKKNYTRREFSSKSFSRSFTLPDNVDEDAIEANYDDGVLRLVLNKAEKALPSKKSINVK
jgi:HSP20 family protein